MNPNTDFIPFARPSLSAAEEEAVLDVIRSGWLTTGRVTAEFEKECAAAAGVKHALAVNSATSGLHLALEAAGVSAGDHVITSPYTFTATAEVIRYMGAHPLFIDIDSEGFNISTAGLERLLEKASDGVLHDGRKTPVMIPVWIGGDTSGRETVLETAKEAGIRVVEDAAHLQPSPLLSSPDGILVYSFYTTKCIATGEGGMVITNDDAAAGRMKMMRFHGIDREAWDRYTNPGHRSWEYDIKAPGFKYNLSDTASALGRIQLEKSAGMLERRKLIAERYDTAFRACDFLKIPPDAPGSTRHLYIIRIVEEKLTIDRDSYAELMTEAGIGISVHYKPLHLMSYYSGCYALKADDFPESLKKYRCCFSLPIYPDLTDEQVSRIIDTVISIGRSRYRS